MTEALPTPQDGRELRPEFLGSAGEYFRIWIVNLLFTLLTLGIFSAWAKVRKKKYFYGCTRLAGDSFDYTADPLAILKGRLVAAAIVAAYLVAGELVPGANIAFWVAGILALPWLAVRAFVFNARNSAWRGIRFDFTATGGACARQFLLRLPLVAITAGAALPWFLARLKAFVLGNHAFGMSQWSCDIPARRFYGVYLRAFGIMVLLVMPIGALSWALGTVSAELPEALSWLRVGIPVALTYLAYAVAAAYVQARTANLAWSGTRAPGLQFSCTLGALAMARLYLVNLAAIIASAGLLIPWATVRTYRYRLSQFAAIADDATAHKSNPDLPAIGAASQELGDLFNLDLGI